MQLERPLPAQPLRLLLALALAVLPPGLAAADFYEARAYFRQGKFQKAIEVIDQVASSPPELVLMKAECLEKLDRLPEALAVLR
ncbi:MAG: CDC27 family protein, partial [Candidatus Wallbacteria bacterium]|nr:CDC27 family protein [Candidatus Wallbacteria bacterium]